MTVNGRFPALFLLLLTARCCCVAWETCSDESANRFCPTGNTCCKIQVDGVDESFYEQDKRKDQPSVGCIPGDMGKYNGTCCTEGGGGCPVGYTCSVQDDFRVNSKYFCQATPSAPLADHLTQRLPRYRLCSANKRLSQVHGLDTSSHIQGSSGKLAYYSSHGPIESIPSSRLQSMDTVWIFIHGMARNADDYFCSALAASQARIASLTSSSSAANTLVIAPWFADDSDQEPFIDKSFLIWSHEDPFGSWRYGADSMHHNVSSFAALDVLVETLNEKLGASAKIVVSGHSSGGQMVHRWAFLTPSWTHNVKAIVANPSSYLYLTPLRKIIGKWETPDIQYCPQYDSWEWGLSNGGNLKVPYRDRALSNSSAVTLLIEEFRNRHVVYLAGALDVCNETDSGLVELGLTGAHCHSHGLETTCMDQLQGTTRMERSKTFLESLQHVWTESTHCHKQVIVSGVGHDHSLIINSPEGMEAIFGNQCETMIKVAK